MHRRREVRRDSLRFTAGAVSVPACVSARGVRNVAPPRFTGHRPGRCAAVRRTDGVPFHS
ncbi:hypothetical protein ACQP1W_37165 [Spirillospora sp. CA-255316]